jgi:hypothetical protein
MDGKNRTLNFYKIVAFLGWHGGDGKNGLYKTVAFLNGWLDFYKMVAFSKRMKRMVFIKPFHKARHWHSGLYAYLMYLGCIHNV